MREGDIRLIKPFMGGGHCSKHKALAHHFCAAMLSKKVMILMMDPLALKNVVKGPRYQ